MAESVLERVVFHAGRIFIQAGETHTDAFIIQSGEVIAYVLENGEKIEISRHGKNAVLAESNLLIDGKSDVFYESLSDTTAIKITRQDFEKKLSRLDQGVYRIIQTLLQKMKRQEMEDIDRALKAKRIDVKTREIVDYLLRDMTDERKTRYEDILLPHFNIMIKSIDDLRIQEKYAIQRENLEKKISELKNDREE